MSPCSFPQPRISPETVACTRVYGVPTHLLVPVFDCTFVRFPHTRCEHNFVFTLAVLLTMNFEVCPCSPQTIPSVDYVVKLTNRLQVNRTNPHVSCVCGVCVCVCARVRVTLLTKKGPYPH